MTVALESRCRIDAVTPCRYSIDMGAGRGSAGLTLRERLLAERFHRAPLVALGGVELAPALSITVTLVGRSWLASLPGDAAMPNTKRSPLPMASGGPPKPTPS